MGDSLIGKTGTFNEGGTRYACICTAHTEGTYSLTIFKPGAAPEFQTGISLGQGAGRWYPID